MARMEDVEASVGEDDLAAPPTSGFGDATAGGLAIENLVGEPLPGHGQLIGVDDVGAGMADGDPGGHVGQPAGFGQVPSRAEAGREHRHDGVAGAGHVGHVADLRRDVGDPVGGGKGHPLGPSGDQHGVESQRDAHLGGGAGDRLVPRQGRSDGPLGLQQVRGHDGRPGVGGEIGLLGVNHAGDAAMPAAIDDRPGDRGRDHPFLVVGQHDRGLLVDQGQDPLEEPLGGGGEGGPIAVAVQPQELLLAVGEDAGLADRPQAGPPVAGPVVPRPWRSGSRGAAMPSMSSPTSPARVTGEPRPASVAATLPAPPGVWTSPARLTTGTGASGEIRRTVPMHMAVEHHIPDDHHRDVKRGVAFFLGTHRELPHPESSPALIGKYRFRSNFVGPSPARRCHCTASAILRQFAERVSPGRPRCEIGTQRRPGGERRRTPGADSHVVVHALSRFGRRGQLLAKGDREHHLPLSRRAEPICQRDDRCNQRVWILSELMNDVAHIHRLDGILHANTGPPSLARQQG